MTSEIVLLYLFTRLDGIKEFGVAGLVITGFTFVIATIGTFMMDPDREYEKREHERCKTIAEKAKWWLISFILVVVFVPSQKAAMFIVAGTGVIEAAKTDTAQRIAGKSVSVVEKYLDDMLAEQTKKDEKK